MNTFKHKCVYWGLIVLASIFVMILGLRAALNGTALNIFYIYPMAIVDVVLLILIIPIISLMAIHEIDGFMSGSRLLAFNSRLEWWIALKRKLLIDCLIFVILIIFPIFLIANIFIAPIKTYDEWLYIIFLFLTYFMYFFILALCITVVKIKFHQSFLAVSFALLISFFPNLISFILRQLKIPTISGLLNLSYALDKDSFYWQRCGNVCIVLIVLSFLIEIVNKILLKKQDIYWK